MIFINLLSLNIEAISGAAKIISTVKKQPAVTFIRKDYYLFMGDLFRCTVASLKPSLKYEKETGSSKRYATSPYRRFQNSGIMAVLAI
jgi:hypothetical protein